MAPFSLILFLTFIKFTQSGTHSVGTSAPIATCLACKSMCPLCMPSMLRARKAARFYDNPTESIIWANSTASGYPRIFKVFEYDGFDLIAPPLVPTEIGISIYPCNTPFSMWYFVKGEYLSPIEA